MVTIYYANGTLAHTCTYPCGEGDLSLKYKADFTPNSPNVGLSTSIDNLKFIKSDRTAILALMSEDLFVIIDSFPKFQMDIENYKDDGDFLEIPLISTSIRDILQNTNLGQLNATRAHRLQIKKSPFLRGVLTSEEVPLSLYVLQQSSKTFDVAREWNQTEGKFLNLVQSDTASNFLTRYIPIVGSSNVSATHNTEINAELKLETLATPPSLGACILTIQSYYTVNYTDGTSSNPISLGNVNTGWIALSQSMTLSVAGNFPSFLTFANTHNGKAVESCIIAYELQFAARNSSGSAYLIDYTRSGSIEVQYQDYIDYYLPAIDFSSIVTAVSSNLGITIDTSLVTLPNLYLTSPNGEEFWNTNVADILDTIANIYGLLLQFSLTAVTFRSYSIIYTPTAISVPDFYDHKTTGRQTCFKFGLTDTAKPVLQYANAPVIMWDNEYYGFRDFSTQTSNIMQIRLHINGAEFLEKLRTDDKTVFLIEGTSSNYADGSDLPINYQLSASEITEWRNDEYASEVFTGLQLSPVIDTTPVFLNPDTNIDTRQDITLPTTRLVGSQVHEFTIPFYQSIINKVLNGDIIKFSIDGNNYVLTECSCGLLPNEVKITCRKIQ